MTIKEFLDCLNHGDWQLDADGNLSDRNEYCPLWHVYHSRFEREDDDEPDDYVNAGRLCGLRERDAIAIAQAADNRGHPRLRKRLLACVGLDESKLSKDNLT